MSKNKIYISIFLLWLVTISGMIGIYIGKSDWFLPKTPINLLLGAVILYWNFPPKNGLKSILIWSLTFFIGMLMEALGVKYGWIFGGFYTYGANFGPKILGVPWMIGVNWVLLTFSTGYLARYWAKDFSAILAATLMISLDFFIEPLAPRFDFWAFEQGLAPLQNFVAWFFIALGLQFLVKNEIPEAKNPVPLHHFLSQLVFFAFFYVCYCL
jgi:bisanhydrobacterioruberin hydratase